MTAAFIFTAVTPKDDDDGRRLHGDDEEGRRRPCLQCSRALLRDEGSPRTTWEDDEGSPRTTTTTMMAKDEGRRLSQASSSASYASSLRLTHFKLLLAQTPTSTFSNLIRNQDFRLFGFSFHYMDWVLQ